ncbi:ABC transporter-like protein [Apiospora rasikravindrae]|uniref:ABC transporter-like protein n=1 Tax=Apiospora rasikravindrae TaxID=990691 RepID=A0ABR1TXA1_9PEZI
MTSMESESVATILCTSKQTRFNIATPNYRELDIDGLSIVVTSNAHSTAKGKGKSKIRSEGTEILSNASLRLKAGQRYALLGRNGTGKSTLLKAIAEKLIPGIPEETRIAILQQTEVSDAKAHETLPGTSASQTIREDGLVIEEIIERATARSGVQKEIQALSDAISSTDPYGPLRGLRQLQYHRLQKELFLRDKDARLRSGARGLQARKALFAKEKEVADMKLQWDQPDDEISPEVLAKETSQAADLLAELELQVEPTKVTETERRAKRILSGLGFSDEYMQKPVASLSGGWKMRTALAAVLLQETDILILDEPTNFLDLLGIMWLQTHLASLAEGDNAPTLIIVSHDRDFISLCTDILIIKDKDLTYFHGELPVYEASKAEKKLYMNKMKEAKEKQKEHVEKTIARNMKEGRAKDDQNKIRQAKSRQKKLDDRWGLEVNSQGGRFKLNRDLVGYYLISRAEIEVEEEDRPVRLVLPATTDLRFPGPLLSLEQVSFRYVSPSKSNKAAAPPFALGGITLSVHMGDRIGIVGLNGSGKSTLVKLLVEEAKPTSGNLTTHPRLKIGYYSQHAVDDLRRLGEPSPAGEGPKPPLTSLSLLTREVAGALDEGAVRGLLGSLGLPGRLASDVPLRKLSGGQLVRLQLARLLWRQPHCLVLDEVTTHLDYETVAALRNALRGWEGAVVLVSHDRWFVRGVVEGLVDDADAGGSGDEDVEEEERPRRRVVYRLRAGQLTELQGGVSEFEEGVGKRVRKLMKA